MGKVEKFKVKVGLKEKVPTTNYGNIDLGPYELEYEVNLDTPLESDSDEFKIKVDSEFIRAKARAEIAYGEQRERVADEVKKNKKA